MYKKRFASMQKQTGITLSALTITIIVLLILAGITINSSISENGVIHQALNAGNSQENTFLANRIEMLYTNWQTNRALNDSITISDFWNKLVSEKIIKNKEQDVKGPDENLVYKITTTKGFVYSLAILEGDIPNEQTTEVAMIGSTKYNSLQEAFNAVPLTGIQTNVMVLKNTKEIVTIDTGKNVVLNINEKIIEGSITNNGIATIKGGTINNLDTEHPCLLNSGELEITGNAGIISSGTAIHSYKTVKINGGTISSSSTYTIYNDIGSSYAMTAGNVTNTGGGESIKVQEGAKAIITGGIITSDSKEWTCIGNSGELEIGGNAQITTNANAVQNVGTLVISGGKITGTYYATIRSATNSTLTITNGEIINVAEDGEMAIYIEKEAKAKIVGGTIYNSNKTKVGVANYGELEIAGNTAISSEGNAIGNIGILNINGGKITGTSTYATVYNYTGATYNMTGGEIKNTSTASAIYMQSGTKTVMAGGTVEGVTAGITNYGEVEVRGSIIITSPGNAIKNYASLIVNDGIITGTGTYATVYNYTGAVYTMTEGKITSTGGTVLYTEKGAKSIIQGGNISSSIKTCVTNYGDLEIGGNTKITSEANAIQNYSNLTINGGNITAVKIGITNYGELKIGGSVNIASTGTTVYNYTGSICTMTGGEITNTSTGSAIYMQSGAKAIVTGGKISTTKISIANYGELEIGGTVNITAASHAIRNYSILVINGGIITGTATFSTVYNDPGATLTMKAGTVSNTAGGNAMYNVSGGTATYIGGTALPRNF